ncbi:Cholera enterotoxin subunit A [Colletotrichum siamense]|uniref:Cholera enterotoxin subunit A n=1 Tax=Colletotrichum siamense TaxID=690259 RepID=UPI001872F175|nr:Cholera enterotoxin subunit A [Colletotrichum siamense]KAF5482813.1 Cholera enterotoxin subunit A [Colletotrichum siamense]
MFRHRPLLLFFLGAQLWHLLCHGAPTTVSYVYRGDTRSPGEIKRLGGFLAKGQTRFGLQTADTSLFNHMKGTHNIKSRDEDGFVSTSTSETVAATFVYGKPSAFVYKIHVTPNMIDTVGTLGKYSDFDEELEFAALGGIKYEQIVSWRQLKGRNLGKSTMNKDFDKRKYGSAAAGGVQYQLAGFPPNHKAWREEPWKSHKPSKRDIGKKSGFNSDFPSSSRSSAPIDAGAV